MREVDSSSPRVAAGDASGRAFDHLSTARLAGLALVRTSRRLRPIVSTSLLAPAIYLCVSVLFLGLGPVIHPAQRVIGVRVDPFQHAWFLSWWPHALLHGINPFYTHALGAPKGINLGLTPFDAGPALILSPITLLFGPVVTFNLITVLAPALSAWTAYLLCRRFTASRLGSIVGGYVFGFSCYELARLRSGHPNLELTFLIPLAVLLVVRRWRGELAMGRFVVLLTAVLVGQFLISSEIFATMTAFGLAAMALAAALVAKPDRRRMLRLSIAVAAAYTLSIVPLAPFIYYSATGSSPVSPMAAALFSAAPRWFVTPGAVTRFGHGLFGSPSSRVPPGDLYIGWFLVAASLWFVVRFRRRREAWILSGTLVAVVVASLGPSLRLHGRKVLPLPYALVAHVPFIRYALPDRFVLYAFLILGVMVAMLLGSFGGPSERIGSAADVRRGVTNGWRRVGTYGFAALVVLPLLPQPASFVSRDATIPPFFATGLYQRYLRPDETALVIPSPWSGPSMLIQARTGFAFRMPSGYVSAFQPPGEQLPLFATMLVGRVFPGAKQELIPYLQRHLVEHVLVLGPPGIWLGLLDEVDPSPVEIGGVVVFKVPPALLPVQGS